MDLRDLRPLLRAGRALRVRLDAVFFLAVFFFATFFFAALLAAFLRAGLRAVFLAGGRAVAAFFASGRGAAGAASGASRSPVKSSTDPPARPWAMAAVTVAATPSGSWA
ncbi:MAG: hypothetical protein WBE65_17220, partial [Steroidobacteraceae bacterium]